MTYRGALSIAAVLLVGASASDAGHGSGHENTGHDSGHGDMTVGTEEYPNMCNVGHMQSPIALHRCEDDGSLKNPYKYPVEREDIKHTLGTQKADVAYLEGPHGGGKLKLTPKNNRSMTFSIKSHGKTKAFFVSYCLVFGGSEHQIHLADHDHGQYPAEVQCIGKLEDPHGGLQYGGLSILFDSGTATDNEEGTTTPTNSPFFGQFESNDKAKLANKSVPSKTNIDIDFNYFGNVGPSRYWTYMGSLTIGKCEENTHWIVMYDPVGMSTGQIDMLKMANITGAGKHIAPLNGRHPDGCPVPHDGSSTYGVLGAFVVMMATLLGRA
jgi:carbonic anhydrase